jgi:predicted dehydrogenase
MIDAALIGVSGFAELHYQDLMALHERGLVRLRAVTIINQEEEADKCRTLRKAGCELFNDYQEMLDRWKRRLALCVIPTGIHHHARMTIAALGAGCNVLVEKPIAATIEEVEAIRESELEASRFVAVGYQHIYTPEIRRMKQALLDGAVGTVEVIKCMGFWPRSEGYYRRNNWAGRLRAGEDWVLDAPFNNAFAHWLNLLCFLAGSRFQESATPSSVEAELYRARPIETTDTACMRIDTGEGVPLLLWVTHSCERHRYHDSGPELQVRGTDGCLTWTPEAITYRSKAAPETSWPVSSLEQMRSVMFDAVLRKAAGENSFVCGVDIAGKQTLCTNAAFDSSRINVIAPDYLVEHEKFDDRYIVIQGIEDHCWEAFRREKLWSQMSTPWARAGRRVPVPYDGINGKPPAEIEMPNPVPPEIGILPECLPQ